MILNKEKKSAGKIDSLEQHRLEKQGAELSYTVKGKEYKKIIDSLPKIEEALKNIGFPIPVNYTVTQFIIEAVRNAMKARGSMILSERYGTFEKIMDEQDSPFDLINDTITKGYSDTVITLLWENLSDMLRVSVINNTGLNRYLKERIEKSLSRTHDISEEEIEEIAAENSIFSTKASGMGMGLWMVIQSIKTSGGRLSYTYTDKETAFTLEVPKKQETNQNS